MAIARQAPAHQEIVEDLRQTIPLYSLPPLPKRGKKVVGRSSPGRKDHLAEDLWSTAFAFGIVLILLGAFWWIYR